MDLIRNIFRSNCEFILNRKSQSVRNFILDLCLIILENHETYSDYASLKKIEKLKYDGFLILIKLNENGLKREIIDYIFYKTDQYFGKVKKCINNKDFIYIFQFDLNNFHNIETCKLLYWDYYVQKSSKMRLSWSLCSDSKIYLNDQNIFSGESIYFNSQNIMQMYEAIEKNLFELEFTYFKSPFKITLDNHFRLCKKTLYILLLCIKKANILSNNKIIPLLLLKYISIFLYHKQLIIDKEIEKYTILKVKFDQLSKEKESLKRKLHKNYNYNKRQK